MKFLYNLGHGSAQLVNSVDHHLLGQTDSKINISILVTAYVSKNLVKLVSGAMFCILFLLFSGHVHSLLFTGSGNVNISQDSAVQDSGELQLSGHQTGSARPRQEKKLSDKAAGKVQKNIPQKPKVRNYNYRDDNSLR